MTTTRHRIKTAARRLGYEVTIFRNSVAGQRAQLLRHLGIQRVVDVGANVGQYADSLRELGYRGEIWSFEPLASAYAELERRSQGDSSWRATRTAVGAREGELQLHVSQSSIFSSALPVLDSAVSASPDARSVREHPSRRPSAPFDPLIPSGRRRQDGAARRCQRTLPCARKRSRC